MPRVRVLLFAAYRERAGRAEVSLELERGATVAALVERLRRLFPRLAPPEQEVVVAVNQEYADPSQELREGDEVALIPPVSGGAPMLVQVTEAPLDPEAVTARVRADTHGAVVTFLGTTRSVTDGRRVLYLEYECYLPMALRKLEEVRQEVRQRRGVGEVAVAHRVGRLEVGETSLVVAVGAPHRREAFAACLEVVDRIKQVVPIWKREVFEDGSVWVGSEEAWHPAPREDVTTAGHAAEAGGDS